MKEILSKKQARSIDILSIKKRYVSKKKLMDNAGRLSAQFFLEKIKDPFNQKILVFAGKGDNGGDAIIMHHYLLEYGVESKLYIFDLKSSKSIIANYKISKKHIINNIDEKDISRYHWFIDGIFGIGLNRKIIGSYQKIIKMIQNKNIISLDLPSGLNCDTGNPFSETFIEPVYVLSMGYYKNSNIINKGKKYFKQTRILDIGFPKASKLLDNINTYLIDKGDIRKIIKIDNNPLRNKYDTLCAMIVGSEEYSGAGILCLLSALKSGSGYVRTVVPKKISDLYSNILESVNIPIGNKGYLSKSDYHKIIESGIISKGEPILIGPGLGKKKTTIKLVSELLKYLKNKNNNCVLDASGFEPLYDDFKLKNLPKNCILTPHLGEFKKIFPGIDVDNPIVASRSVIEKLDKRVLILKGPSTIITTSTGRHYIVNNSNSLLATAGSGDVLSGIIIGLLSKGYTIDAAAILGVYIHGLCSIQYFEKVSKYSMTASDIIKILPICLNEEIS